MAFNNIFHRSKDCREIEMNQQNQNVNTDTETYLQLFLEKILSLTKRQIRGGKRIQDVYSKK